MADHQHPGAHLRAELEKRDWRQSDLIFVLGCHPKAVNLIINEKQSVTPSMSKALGQALGLPPDHFAVLQRAYDLENAKEPDPSVTLRSRIQTNYPLREMIRRQWIAECESSDELASEVCHFFEVSRVDDIPHISHAAKRSDSEHIPAAQLAWLFRVRQIAREMPVERFNKSKLEKAVENFSDLRSEPESVRYIPRLLQNAGVRFVVVEPLASGKIDGVCLWLNAQSPVIGMSLRFDRIDNFWFVLRHECAHVLHGHGKQTSIIDTELDGNIDASINEEEKLANLDAADFCVSIDKLQSFYLRKRPLFTEREVMAFAKKMNVHPGLVVGQLQRKANRYDMFRRHLVEVRKHLAAAMVMDGWGDTVPVGR